MKVKTAPEQWHTQPHHNLNIVITFEDRVFEAVYEGKRICWWRWWWRW